MDQLLNSLGSIQNLGGDDGDLGGEDITDLTNDADSDELPRDVENVLGDATIEGSEGTESVDQANSVEARVARCKERQVELESRFEKLQRRINALRSFHVGNHAAQQIQLGVICCEKKLMRNSKTAASTSDSSKVETNKENKEGEENSKPKSSHKPIGRKVARLREVTREHADQTFGRLHAHMKHVQKFADPEATESSSGGESADEHDKYPPGGTHTAPIKERAKYRWLKKRSEYAAQWGWIQSQISDLEFKIRQQTDMYKAYRKAKGAVSLEDPSVSAKRRGDHESGGNSSAEEERSQTCSRVRPVVSRPKRRKLLDTYASHHINHKLNKPSSVNCSCLLPTEWCVLCCGRRHLRPSPDLHTQSRVDCVALLDHSYHAVLSTPDSIPTTTLLSEAAHQKRWLNVPSNGNKNSAIPVHLSKLININEKLPDSLENGVGSGGANANGGKEGGHKRKKRGGGSGNNGRSDEKRRSKQRRNRLSSSVSQKDDYDPLCTKETRDAKELARIKDMASSQDGSRKKRKQSFDIDHVVIPYNMSSTRVQKPKYKEILTPSWRIVDNSYPWPPMGSAKRATTIIKPVAPPKPSSDDPDYEDVSVLAISLLHAKAEEEERIRWATPLGRVHGGQRTRANRIMRRGDSCVTEASSEANTPDPLSPGFIDRVEDIVVQTRPSSPQEDGIVTPMLVSPAATQGDVNGSTSHQLPSAATEQQIADLTAGAVRSRRRTSSQTYRSNRNRNLSEASQGSSRCPSPAILPPSPAILPAIPPPSPASLMPPSPAVLPALATASGDSSQNLSTEMGPQQVVGGGGGETTVSSTSSSAAAVAPSPTHQRYEKRHFPLTDEEMKRVEEEDGMMRPPVAPPPPPVAQPTPSQQPRRHTPPPLLPSSLGSSSAVPLSQTTGSHEADNHSSLQAPHREGGGCGSRPPSPHTASASASTSRTTSRTTSRSSSVCEDDPDWEEQDSESD